MNHLIEAYQTVVQSIRQAEHIAQRAENSVQLIAVSKTFPADDVRHLYQIGQRDFGENYIQEWQRKMQSLSDCTQIVWHIIGQVQSNKSRIVAEYADWLHTLDSEKLARRLDAQRPEHLPPLNVLLEINITGETAKHGITAEQMPSLAQTVQTFPKLNLRGLMCVAQAHASPSQLRQQFQQMQTLLVQLQTIVPHADTLSMGMSSDMNIAIECGANMVRIGSAIFGKRIYPNKP